MELIANKREDDMDFQTYTLISYKENCLFCGREIKTGYICKRHKTLMCRKCATATDEVKRVCKEVDLNPIFVNAGRDVRNCFFLPIIIKTQEQYDKDGDSTIQDQSG